MFFHASDDLMAARAHVDENEINPYAVNSDDDAKDFDLAQVIFDDFFCCLCVCVCVLGIVLFGRLFVVCYDMYICIYVNLNFSPCIIKFVSIHQCIYIY